MDADRIRTMLAEYRISASFVPDPNAPDRVGVLVEAHRAAGASAVLNPTWLSKELEASGHLPDGNYCETERVVVERVGDRGAPEQWLSKVLEASGYFDDDYTR
jgi:hypothetical protein